MVVPIIWQLATITAIKQETPTVKTFGFSLPALTQHRAGQHYDVRLRAPDGYVAQRSYSIASAPENPSTLELTVERIDGGEVSGYLHDVAVLGDRIEIRGPIGGYFVWEAKQGDPLLLIGGGSGVVPLMAMLRHRQAVGATIPTRLLFSTRSAESVIYREELDAMAPKGSGLDAIYTLTRQQPPGWTGYSRRIDPAMLATVAEPLGQQPLVYVCGSTLMVEAAANGLVEIGIGPERIRTERFGPTGN